MILKTILLYFLKSSEVFFENKSVFQIQDNVQDMCHQVVKP